MENEHISETRQVKPTPNDSFREKVVETEARTPVEERVVEKRVVEEPVVEETVVEKTVKTEGLSVQEAFDREVVRAQGLPLDAAITVVQRGMATRGVNAESSVVRDMLQARGY